MPSRRQIGPFFRLELLETRTLLAGDAVAITSTGAYLTNLDADPTSSQVTVVGMNGGKLTIDSNLLPATVKDLKISGFENVTVSGLDKFDSLDLSRIGTFVGAGISVGSTLKVTNVTSVTLGSVAGFATLAGQEMRLEVSDARSATIYSTLDRLTVSSKNDLMLLSGNPKQEIRLELQTSGSTILGPTLQSASQVPTPVIPPSSQIPTPIIPPSSQVPTPVIPPSSQIPTPVIPPSSQVPDPIQTPSPQDPVLSQPAGSAITDPIQQVISPSDLAADPVYTFTGISNGGQSSYTVIVISLSEGTEGNLFLLKLQNAVKQGDANGVKTAFAEYIKNVRSLGTLSYGITLAANTQTRVIVPSFAEAARQFDTTDRLADIAASFSAPLELSNVNLASLNLHLLGGVDFQPLSTVETQDLATENPGPISIAPAKPVATDELRSSSSTTDQPILDQVRSGLATLLTGVDSHIDTVSAYIIDRFGNEFQPGERPVLLVDAKSARSAPSRELDWIEL
ncbi:MAG: hypothetical protein HY735_12040 [Verrucomicrobia bacterium]|nr:hypothetical protein [Verrucomicrobiota bacterium]